MGVTVHYSDGGGVDTGTGNGAGGSPTSAACAGEVVRDVLPSASVRGHVEHRQEVLQLVETPDDLVETLFDGV
jgi:hypothetical protein